MACNEYPSYIILGSGGHTAEMCKITNALLVENPRSDSDQKYDYQPIRFIVAKSDMTSRKKLMIALTEANLSIDDSSFIEVPRSREVGQSWLSTIFTTFYALIWSFWLVWRDQPRLILCNGPGTCVPFCIAAFTWRILRRLHPKSRIVFVESFCRVRTLSLSGRLLLPFVDMFVVQWQKLFERYGYKSNVHFYGRLM